MGFRESWQEPSGQETLWLALRDFTSYDVWLLPPAAWNSDVKATAALIDRHLDDDGVIVSLGYSWGGGWRAPRLARALDALGRSVKHMILCDPVYRSPWMPSWLPLNPLSLTRLPTISIPRNVERVTWFYQRENRPHGHTPVAVNPLTIVEPGIQIKARHGDMDDSPEYQTAAREWVQFWADQIGRS